MLLCDAKAEIKRMSTKIQDYRAQAQTCFERLKRETSRRSNLTIEITEILYTLERIKIAVAYRTKLRELSHEEKEAFEEIKRIYEESLAIKNEIFRKSGEDNPSY